jgi:Mg-chelatase subunit ChlD
MTPSKNVTKVQTQTKQSQRKMRQESIKTDTGKTDKPLNIIATAGGTSGAASSAMSMSTGSSGGPRSSFFGSGGNAYNVVYVIDRSGSMVHTFDVAVRPELLRSIGRLRDSQMFHVILFAQGPPVELKYKRLVPATKRHKKEAASFLFADEVRPEGETDPVPALKRAFAVLSGARKKGRLIYLLTDGIFPDNEGVLRVIASQNKDKKVHINTFLYGTAPKEAVDVMTAIAEQNGGRYKFVEHE